MIQSMKTVPQLAEELAKAHVEDDPKMTDVYFVEDVENEVRLVEVSTALSDAGPGEVLPFRFGPAPEEGVPLPSIVVLLSPAEWRAVQKGELALPTGWEKLKKVV
jgi:hypothetical protein